MKNKEKGVIGIRVNFQKIGSTASWSKTRNSWTLIVRNYGLTEKYEVVLESSLLSRHKKLLLNNATVFDGTWPFPNFHRQFDLNESHKAKIIEEGDSYELYIDGKSFPHIYDSNYAYEPPKITVDSIEPITFPQAKPKPQVSEAVRRASLPSTNKMLDQFNSLKISAPVYEKKEQLSVFDQMKQLKRRELDILMQSKKKQLMKAPEPN